MISCEHVIMLRGQKPIHGHVRGCCCLRQNRSTRALTDDEELHTLSVIASLMDITALERCCLQRYELVYSVGLSGCLLR